MLENTKVALAHVETALQKWLGRGDAGPGLLKAFIRDALAEGTARAAAAAQEKERRHRAIED